METNLRVAWCCMLTLALTAGSMATQGAIPISGRPVPNMKPFDTVMTDFMDKWDVEAGLVGIMRNNQVVYLRGFGSMDEGVNMPENAMIRQASATKPATAAAIRMLAEDGAFGPEGLDRKVFQLTVRGVSNNGLLDVVPFPKLGDTRYANITLRHLLRHRGGFFPRVSQSLGGPDDPVFRSRDIAADMDIDSPPSRHNVMRWTLGWKLQNAPGDVFEYSNFGYLVLGEVIHQFWPAGYVDFLHRRVFTPGMWVARSELEGARTLREDRNPREPWYRGGGNALSVFDNDPPIATVPREYGGYSLPTLLAHGGLVASVPTMLALGHAYHLDYPDIGEANTPDNPTGTQSHGGALFGLLTFIDHRSDGIVLYAAINRRLKDGDEIPLPDLKASLSALLDKGPGKDWGWPSTTSDGFWVVPNSALPGSGLGGYHSPWLGFGAAIAKADPNSRIRVKAGTTSWKGTISKRLFIDAPLGAVVIGQ
jgi:CubicO group peptidase (beta-lactamase class C family)